MLSRSGWLVVRLLLGCALLAGCQPDVPVPSPTASYRCTPEAGGAEYDCTPHEHDDMVVKDKLYAEAEAVYRRFLAEDERIARIGGVTEPTEVLLETTSGFFLKEAMAGYRSDKERGITVRDGERVIKSVVRLAGLSKGGSVVALRVCTDSMSVRVFEKSKYVGKGSINSDDLYFGRVDERLVIIGVDGEQVKSC